MRRLLDYDEITGIRTWHDYDPVTKETTITTDYVDNTITDVLERNKALYNHDDKGWSPTKEWRRVASIPVSLMHEWLVNEGIDVLNKDHWPAVKRKLNSSDYLYLRTAPGVV